MTSTYDVVVVGSGHNGLIAAAYLAKAGQKVLVLEKNGWFGGGVYTAESVAPGFRHDWHSATHIVIQANPLLLNDELGLLSKYGLSYQHPEAVFSTIFDDHSYIVSYVDLDRTCQSIARISPRDADAYRAFALKSKSLLPMIVQGMFVPPPPQGPFWALLDMSAEGQELMHAVQKSMLELVDELFEHEKVKIHLLKFAAEMLVGPDEKGTGAILFNMPGFVHTYPPGVPVGGSVALVEALIRCLQDKGAELRKNAAVTRVNVEGGRAVGVTLADGETIRARTCVIGQIHPWLLGEMIEGLDPRVAGNARRTQTASFAIMAGHYALNEPPRYLAGEEPGKVALTNFAPSTLERYRRVFDDFRYGDLSGDSILAAHLNSQFDASRAPAGKGALTVFGFAPFVLRDGGSAAWDRCKQEVAGRTLRQFQHYAPNVSGGNIVAQTFDTPLDVLRHSPTFQNGDVGGVGKYFHQIGGHRPTPDLAQYAVPGIERMYLAGTFMHPPGGVTGGGRATAVRICGDIDIDFNRLTE